MSIKKLKVEWKKDNIWEVLDCSGSGCDDEYDNDESPLFEGTISECESYLRLKEKGYIR